MDYTIREIAKTEYAVLNDFLYEAIYIPKGMRPPDKTIIEKPELQVYVEDFGSRPDDRCLVAEADGKIVGAVWVRIMNDYGHIDDETPSFAISLDKAYRGRGIGTELMIKMLSLLKEHGYQKASLSVQKENYAAKMYLKIGFVVVGESENEYTMAYDLQ